MRRRQSNIRDEIIHKFTQKYIPSPHAPAKTTITNLYLTKTEYELLARLPAQDVEKTRNSYIANGQQYSLDVFDGRHWGLVLVEIEFENEVRMQRCSVPEFAIKDVTCEPLFRGGSLAAVSQQAFAEDLAGFLGGNC